MPSAEELVVRVCDWMTRHRAERDRMLAAAVEMLASDERFVATWLGGSFGRGNDDALSDVDLTVVVADADADRLCRREHQVGAGATPERMAVFSSIGEPAIVHENHFNAPSGGSFTACVYASGVQVDWVFVPAATAVRPAETRLLFGTTDIPAQAAIFALSDEERRQRVSEQTAFFWMMVVPTTKVLLRGDLVQFHLLLDMLYRIVEEVERLLARQPSRYRRGSRAPFLTTASEQRDAVVTVCDQMEALTATIVEAGASVLEASSEAVRPWLGALLPRSSS